MNVNRRRAVVVVVLFAIAAVAALVTARASGGPGGPQEAAVTPGAVTPATTVRPSVLNGSVRSLPQVIAADSVAGETDYLLSVVARDVEELGQVLASLSARGGQRLVTYLRLAEVKPSSPLPLGPQESRQP